jgi:hypothetical protein
LQGLHVEVLQRHKGHARLRALLRSRKPPATQKLSV